ncbi:hypothetical protein [Asaia platycodi]|uniref:hypothetical protein n=1 Tax=Asaia platycodi TaxID=610243 RepID=UPI0019018154|nr:hypothetical protein [Asaia platycodi]
MKIGFVSDSLGALSFDQMLDQAAALGVSGVEINTGGWSQAPHIDLPQLRQSLPPAEAFCKLSRAAGSRSLRSTSTAIRFTPSIAGRAKSFMRR